MVAELCNSEIPIEPLSSVDGSIDFPSLEELQQVASLLGLEQWRRFSDVAQVVANYLVTHPRVQSVRYPGLKTDPLFTEAANVLRSGFGPYIWFQMYSGSTYKIDCTTWIQPQALIEELEALLKLKNR